MQQAVTQQVGCFTQASGDQPSLVLDAAQAATQQVPVSVAPPLTPAANLCGLPFSFLLQVRMHFRPEFINRIDEFIIFQVRYFVICYYMGGWVADQGGVLQRCVHLCVHLNASSSRWWVQLGVWLVGGCLAERPAANLTSNLVPHATRTPAGPAAGADQAHRAAAGQAG